MRDDVSLKFESFQISSLSKRLLLTWVIFCESVYPHHSTAGAAEVSSPQPPEVTVKAPRPPTDQELAGESVSHFITHHSSRSVFTGQIGRWHTGVCPVTMGLTDDLNSFVSARIRAVAAAVGAPAPPAGKCQSNVNIIFAMEPQKVLDEIADKQSVLLGFHYSHQTKKIATLSHPIQGWYVTATRGRVETKLDEALPLWPGVPAGTLGSRLSTGLNTDIVHVLIVADVNKVIGYKIGSLADYLSMVVLSQAQSPNSCDPLPSILDLMSTGCPERDKPTAITAGDLAFLKGLYRIFMAEPVNLEKDDIQDQMMRSFRAH